MKNSRRIEQNSNIMHFWDSIVYINVTGLNFTRITSKYVLLHKHGFVVINLFEVKSESWLF